MKLRRRISRFLGNITGERAKRYHELRIIRIDRELDRLIGEAQGGYRKATDPHERLKWKNLLLWMRMKARINGYQCREALATGDG